MRFSDWISDVCSSDLHPPTACRARSTARSPRRKPRRGQLFVAKLGRTGRLSDIASAVDAAIHEPVRDLPAAGSADGSLRPVNVERTASAIFGAVAFVGLHAIPFRYALAPFEVLADVDGLLLHIGKGSCRHILCHFF